MCLLNLCHSVQDLIIASYKIRLGYNYFYTREYRVYMQLHNFITNLDLGREESIRF